MRCNWDPLDVATGLAFGAFAAVMRFVSDDWFRSPWYAWLRPDGALWDPLFPLLGAVALLLLVPRWRGMPHGLAAAQTVAGILAGGALGVTGLLAANASYQQHLAPAISVPFLAIAGTLVTERVRRAWLGAPRNRRRRDGGPREEDAA